MKQKFVIIASISAMVVVGITGLYLSAYNQGERQTGGGIPDFRDEVKDLRIKSEVGSLRAALEIYFVQQSAGTREGYPASLDDLAVYSDAWADVVEPEHFHYQQTNSGQGYILEATLYSGEKIRVTESERQPSSAEPSIEEETRDEGGSSFDVVSEGEIPQSWQTHHNNKFNFDFSYPPSLKILSADDGTVSLGTLDYKGADTPTTIYSNEITQGVRFEVQASSRATPYYPQDFVDRMCGILRGEPVECVQKEFQGLPAAEVVEKSNGHIQSKRLFVKRGIYDLSFDLDIAPPLEQNQSFVELFEQMLSTFRFFD